MSSKGSTYVVSSRSPMVAGSPKGAGRRPAGARPAGVWRKANSAPPTNAIVLTDKIPPAGYTRESFIVTKAQLLVPPPPGVPGTPQRTTDPALRTRSIWEEGLGNEPV